MENLGYLFVAYFLIWAVLFGYVFSFSRRQRGILREIESLKSLIHEKGMDRNPL